MGVSYEIRQKVLRVAWEEVMRVLDSSEWHEDYGSSIFISYSRDKYGNILGETPELYYGQGYLEEDFDFDKWTHFIDGNFNFIFSDVDPINFPQR